MRHVKSEDIKFKETPSGELLSILVGRHKSSGEAKQQTVAMISLKSGMSSDPHFHKEREESYFFLEGHGIAKIDQTEISIKTGDLIFAAPGERHQFKNAGQSELRYIVFTAPSWIPEDSHS